MRGALSALVLAAAAACAPLHAPPPKPAAAAAPSEAARVASPPAAQPAAKATWRYYTGHVGARYRAVGLRIDASFKGGEGEASYLLDFARAPVGLRARFHDGKLELFDAAPNGDGIGSLRFRLISDAAAPAHPVPGTFFAPLPSATAEMEIELTPVEERGYRAAMDSSEVQPREVDVVQALSRGAAAHTLHVEEDPFDERLRVDVLAPSGAKVQSITWEAPTCAKCGRVGATAEAVRFLDFDFDGHLDLLLLSHANKGGSCYEPHRFDPARGTFAAAEKSGLCEPEAVPARKEVLSNFTDITACDSTSFRTRYAWRVDRLVEIAEETVNGPNRCPP